MYQMDVRHKPVRGLKAAGLIAGIVAGIVLVVFAANLLSATAPGAGYVAYALAIVMAYFVYKRFVVEYRYRWEEGVLMIERLAGQRARPLHRVDMANVIYYGDAGTAPAADRVMRFALADAPGTQRVIVTGGERLVACVVQPDDKLDGLIRAGLEGKKEQA